MMRIRTIKPEFFAHEDLFDAEIESGLPIRLAYVGLWCAADREGRFKWKARELKSCILPHDNIDFCLVLETLLKFKFIERYTVDSQSYGYIRSWKRHQCINIREAKSAIPTPDECMYVHAHASTGNAHAGIATQNDAVHACILPQKLRAKVFARDKYQCVRCGSLDELIVDLIFPESMGGTHAITNLKVLCKACKYKRLLTNEAFLDDLKKDGLTMDDMQRTCMHVHARGEGKGKEGKGREDISITQKQKRACRLPENFCVKTEHIDFANKNQTADPHSEIEAFKNYHLSKGNTFLDWDRAFYTWLRNSSKFNRGNHGTGNNGTRARNEAAILSTLESCISRGGM